MKNKAHIYIILVAVVTLSLLSPDLSATIRHVPGQYQTIQDAANSSIDGDTIMLASGVFTGVGNRDVDITGKSLVIISEFGADSTVIDCQGSAQSPHRAIQVDNGLHLHPGPEIIEVSGITFRNGYAPAQFINGTEYEAGGAILGIFADSFTLSNCVFENCTSVLGGAIVFVGIYSTVIDCQFGSNSAQEGGALLFSSYLGSRGDLQITRCRLDSNYASGVGGSISVWSLSSLSVNESVFCNNSAISGGSIFARNDCTISVANSTFVGGGSAVGSAIYQDGFSFYVDSRLTLVNSIIAFADSGEPIHGQPDSLNISCTNIYGNLAGDWVGPISSLQSENGNFSLDPLFCDLTQQQNIVSQASSCLPTNNSCGVLVGAIDTSSVTACILPTAPTIYEPIAGDTGVLFDLLPEVAWGPSNDPDSVGIGFYTLALALDSEFISSVSYDSLLDTSLFLPDSLSFGSKYWWIVTVHDLSGQESTSDTVTVWTWELGDVNHDHSSDIVDLTYYVDWLFGGGQLIEPMFVGDFNGDCSSDIVDLTYIVDYLFGSGPAPVVGCE